MRDLRNKTREETLEEAYIFLELDNPQRVETKKKGVVMNFLNNGHPAYKLPPEQTQTAKALPMDYSQISRGAKMRNFTDE